MFVKVNHRSARPRDKVGAVVPFSNLAAKEKELLFIHLGFRFLPFGYKVTKQQLIIKFY